MKLPLETLMAGKDLSAREAQNTMKAIMSGEVSDAQIAGFLTALRAKGESIDEIISFAKVIRGFASKVELGDIAAVDTCGTGGDGLSTFNISTTAAFVAAGAGVSVAKHGNRSLSSKSGSADVLEELGINVNLDKRAVESCMKSVGITFMFAPLFHSSMKNVAAARKELGIRTVFNILGPLANPADVKRQVYGVYDPGLTGKLAGALKGLGSKRAMVVCGEPGMDEISTVGRTKVSELNDGGISEYELRPEQFGFREARLEDLKGSGPKENAEILREILLGEKGPRRDIVALNAAGAIYVGGFAKDMREGLEKAEESVSSGAALEKLEDLIKFSNA